MAIIDAFFSIPRPYKRVISVCIDLIFIQVAFWGAFWTRLGEFDQTHNIAYWYLVSFLSVVTVTCFIRIGFYRAILRYLSVHAIFTLAIGSLVSSVVFVLATYFFGLWVPRTVAIIYLAYLFILTGGARLSIRVFFAQLEMKRKPNVIVYGAGVAGRQLVNLLRQGDELNPVVYIDDNHKLQRSVLQGLTVYKREQLSRLVAKFDVKQVLLAMPSATRSQRKAIVTALVDLPVEVLSIPNLDAIVHDNVSLDQLYDVPIEDLLGRESVLPNEHLMEANIKHKVVMVTGAGGSIGSELCRQIVLHQPQTLLLFELSEFALYTIEKELSEYIVKRGLDVELIPLLGSVQRINRLEAIMTAFKVDTIYHAAAYKHVPMVEYNVVEGVRNNVFGTFYTAQAAINSGVSSFVLISTDKAVRPTNVMGTTKRMAELGLQALAEQEALKVGGTRFCMVRFGNVLGSSGSVIPLFKRQIKEGGPITITHPDIIRYFMTIPEAAQLVIQAGAMGKGGDVFVLDMGKPVKIVNLAENLVKLSGLEVKSEQNPYGDIEFKYTGLRPGEKLYEELLIGDNVNETEHSRIMTANERFLPLVEYQQILDQLDSACHDFEHEKIRQILMEAPTDFNPSDGIGDVVWKRKQLTH
ncbi:nucleoside-diphosphate sugar epimerase/dehydratase [Photobacterium phosphoreum]|uniref:nucleoside-diphosphate sugar epimerase/dehydratase n=1 Tax=Photobacterium phosphoreum TaxID=659 RepID=UPI000D1628F9|nr:nucleoside-diphosphate sugar epimerase/dehydratase [Photobacterium phosphoreum]MCD9480553.1 NAD-dependent epimerase/dehydratase family protein [Photobacterium phosphoreum]MCD9485089.1 NAD-dependent epimerase/dehydratase family protein [Photobacterium phosphoreum]PSU56733.1 nucleoside-diphosphate sugar epimerase [Photobacterium phosphoreum]